MALLFVLFFLLTTLYGEETTVVADSAAYDGKLVTLKGNIILEHVMGTISAEMAELKRDEEKKTHLDFPWIHAETNVVINLKDGSILECAQAAIDYVKKTSIFSGSPQIYFCDNEKKILADLATIDFYETLKGEIKPCKILLEGNVQLIHLVKNQQAFADRVEYYPDDARIIFQGNPALFYDPAKEIQLSARHIQRDCDPKTGVERLQGFGKVQFRSSQDALLKVKDKLHWKDTS